MEWDAKKAINSLYGRLISGCSISNQMAKYTTQELKKVDRWQKRVPMPQVGDRRTQSGRYSNAMKGFGNTISMARRDV